jgi:long-subunit acyl-CoA synthetase (AMP-forming)
MVRGDNVMSCYYKDPVETGRTLEPDGWLHTGDLGYLDGDGFVFVTGRIKELIIKGGENIAPREIDEALLKHPACSKPPRWASRPALRAGNHGLCCPQAGPLL